MEIEVQLTGSPIAEKISPPASLGQTGAWIAFRGIVRGEEDGRSISALEYEAYPEMAVREIRRLLETISMRHPCLAARVIHRVGVIPVGDTAIYVGVAAPHRAGAIALLGQFMDRLKQDVPIWKRRALPATKPERGSPSRSTPDHQKSTESFANPAAPTAAGRGRTLRSLDEAISEICSHCQLLSDVRVPLADAFGRVLRETVCAPEDMPAADRSTRDGYAVLLDDPAESFQIVDTIHAADWKPRPLKPGEAVRVATGAALPGGGLRVVMQENVERHGGRIRVVKPDHAAHIRLRGEEVRAGQPVLPAGNRLSAGALALLAAAGCVQPLVSPRLRVVHFTTGDELVPPGQTPQPGQIRDSNSILIRGLLQRFPCDLEQSHLPEDFERAKSEIESRKSEIESADLVLVSGGASVGEQDFTRPLLEWLGFGIVFSQVNVRPGRPLIFGVGGRSGVPASRPVGSLASPNRVRVAFGLPGNPLSHFVCFHFAVATALARLAGGAAPRFLRGRLAVRLADEPSPRETLWPARLEWTGVAPRLIPLAWTSSGDATSLAVADALVRVPADSSALDAGAEVDFLPSGLW
jgi:molybdopterin molybdotransferase